MGVKALVFDGQDRLLHVDRNPRHRHVPPLLARTGRHQGRQQRCIELHVVDLAGADDFQVPDSNRRHPRAASCRHGRKRDTDDLAAVRSAAGNQRHPVRDSGELSGLRGLRALSVAELIQAGDEIRLGQRLSAAELDGTGVHAWDDPLPLAMQAIVDHARIRDVKVAGDGRTRRGRVSRGGAAADNGTTGVVCPYAGPCDAVASIAGCALFSVLGRPGNQFSVSDRFRLSVRLRKVKWQRAQVIFGDCFRCPLPTALRAACFFHQPGHLRS